MLERYIFVVVIAFTAAIITYSSSDNSLNSAGMGTVNNYLGMVGSTVSDIALQFFG